MATVHRFTDPKYAGLTVQLRRGENPALLFDRLHALGLVVVHQSAEDAHLAIARAARAGDAVTTATNDEARALNTSIRDVRVRHGAVDNAHTTHGSDGLPIGAGDVIQTRRNHAELGVANRQTWSVQQVTLDGGVWAIEAGTDRHHQRGVRLPAAYVAEHTHLAYAATSYGVQSATTPAAHTLLSDGLDAAGLYVGMTRGRHRNTVHLVAADEADAREQFTAALQRDRADRGLADATLAARDAVSGLVPDGPVAFVNAERDRLRESIQAAEREATRWEHALGALTRQSAEHHAEYEHQTHVVAAADAHLVDVRTAIAAPLIELATADGTGYLTAQERMWQANRALSTTGRFGRRPAARTAREATGTHAAMQDVVHRRWGHVPLTGTHLPFWAEAVVEQRVHADPRVIEAQQNSERAHLEQQELTAHHAAARSALWQNIGGGHRTGSLQARVTELRGHAHQARDNLAEIEALPVAEAEQLIRYKAARATAESVAEAARQERAAEASRWHPPPPMYQPGPQRDVGPSL